MKAQIVIDTNVFVSALRSKRGASFKLLSLIDSGIFEVNISVPLILEYEDAAKRELTKTKLSFSDVEQILDYLCATANQREIYFLWRPYLKDPKDDLVLELAVEAGCDCVITYNLRDFAGAEKFGLQVMTPKDFLKKKGVIS